METKETVNIEYFEKKFAEAKKEYDLLGEKISEFIGTETDKPDDCAILVANLCELENAEKNTLKETIKRTNKLSGLIGKRTKLLNQQLKRDQEEMKFREKNGLPPLTKLRDIEDWSGEDE